MHEITWSKRGALELLRRRLLLSEDELKYFFVFTAYRRVDLPGYQPHWRLPERDSYLGACDDCEHFVERVLEPREIRRRARVTAQCPSCGRWWKASRKSWKESFVSRRRVVSWYQPGRFRPGRVATLAEVVRHLSWDTGRHFKVVGLHTGEKSTFYVVDLDFKALLDPVDRQRWELRSRQEPGVDMAEFLGAKYESLFEQFREQVVAVVNALPGTPLAIRSSWTHGVHLYGFLTGPFPAVAVAEALRSRIERHGLSGLSALDAKLHPHKSQLLRLPLGLKSVFLDERTLRPMFPGRMTPEDQVAPALKWLCRESEYHNIRKVSLDELRGGSATPECGAIAAPDLVVVGDEKAPPPPKTPREFDRYTAVRVYRDGIPRPGMRRRLTAQVALLALERGFYGDEVNAFVNSWLRRRHNGESVDVNAALKAGDRNLRGILIENEEIVHACRRYFAGRDVRVKAIPLSWLKKIVHGVGSLTVGRRDFYRVVAFAFRLHVRVEALRWREAIQGAEVPFADKLWKRVHSDHVRLRGELERAGLLVKAREGSFGRAALWSFPVLLEPVDERVGLHMGLLRLLQRRGVTSKLSKHHARITRRLARDERNRGTWGRGQLARAAVKRIMRKPEHRW